MIFLLSAWIATDTYIVHANQSPAFNNQFNIACLTQWLVAGGWCVRSRKLNRRRLSTSEMRRIYDLLCERSHRCHCRSSQASQTPPAFASIYSMNTRKNSVRVWNDFVSTASRSPNFRLVFHHFSRRFSLVADSWWLLPFADNPRDELICYK